MIKENSPIAKAVDHFGGVQNTAKIIGSSRQAVYNWLEGSAKISPEFARKLELATGGTVTRSDLRPDIFEPAA